MCEELLIFLLLTFKELKKVVVFRCINSTKCGHPLEQELLISQTYDYENMHC